jgi:hypothetical protein
MGNSAEQGKQPDVPTWPQKRHKHLMLPEKTSLAPSELVLAPSIPQFSVRQEDRLRAFQNITRRVTEQQARIDNQERRKILIYDAQGDVQVDEKGNAVGITITQDMVTTWRDTAINMYEGFSSDPNMRQAADGFLDQLNANKESETQRFKAWWDATEGESL